MINLKSYLIVGRCSDLTITINSIAHRFMAEVIYSDEAWLGDLIECFQYDEALDLFAEIEPELFTKYENQLDGDTFTIVGDVDDNVFGIGTTVPIELNDYKPFIKTMKKVYVKLFQEDHPLQLFSYTSQY